MGKDAAGWDVPVTVHLADRVADPLFTITSPVIILRYSPDNMAFYFFLYIFALMYDII